MKIDKILLDSLTEQAKETPRLRMNYDMRTSSEDRSQRMLNALLPGTPLPIHRHRETTETIVVLRGRMEEIYYEVSEEKIARETERILLSADGPVQGLSIPVGQWHGVNILEPTVILECKDGKYEPLSDEDIVNTQK